MSDSLRLDYYCFFSGSGAEWLVDKELATSENGALDSFLPDDCVVLFSDCDPYRDFFLVGEGSDVVWLELLFIILRVYGKVLFFVASDTLGLFVAAIFNWGGAGGATLRLLIWICVGLLQFNIYFFFWQLVFWCLIFLSFSNIWILILTAITKNTPIIL